MEKMKIYLSSTYNDLKVHRTKVARRLRQAGCDVVMMEEYAARDLPVPLACKRDVGACDLYVGVFAWRYGYVPEDDNPDRLSVTEMEYAAAGEKPMTRLTFLLEEKARWPESRKDPDLARITDLRKRLQKQASGYFVSADDLSAEVLAALRVHESTRIAYQLDDKDVMLKAHELGPSYILNIQQQLGLLGKEQFVDLQIGPTPWWNTRLHLVAALARDFGRTRGIVISDADGSFLMMASPAEICHRLAMRWPAVEQAYAKFRDAVQTERIQYEIGRYPYFAAEALGQPEPIARHVLSKQDVVYELGIARNAEIVDVSEKNPRFLLREIYGRQTPYVALVRDGRLEGVVDRQMLGDRVIDVSLTR
jgi:hypothetical protein